MDQIESWWNIAQVAGAGAAVVLGPVAWLLWNRVQKDTDYIRESDKNTLTVLTELTRLLESVGADQSGLIAAINHAAQDIKDHITERTRHNS